MYDVYRIKLVVEELLPQFCVVSRDGDFWVVLDLLTFDLRLQNQRHDLYNVSRVSTGRKMSSQSCSTLDFSLLCALCTLFFFENTLLFALEFQSGVST